MSDERISTLLAFAKSLGISDARMLDVKGIVVDDRFRTYCQDPRCPNYDTSINCPPHCMTPSEFREYMKRFTQVLAFKFDMPVETMLGPSRREAALLLHEVTAAIEHKAQSLGFDRACGYSGGGCKVTLCYEHDSCAALEDREGCRHPDQARPSLSGMGVDWYELSKQLGWVMQKTEGGDANPQAETVMMAGLVFLE